jgi:hypothetical protein
MTAFARFQRDWRYSAPATPTTWKERRGRQSRPAPRLGGSIACVGLGLAGRRPRVALRARPVTTNRYSCRPSPSLSHCGSAGGVDAHRPLREHTARALIEYRGRVRGLVRVRSDHNHLLRPSCWGYALNGSPVDTSQLGRCHARIKSDRWSAGRSDNPTRQQHPDAKQSDTPGAASFRVSPVLAPKYPRARSSSGLRVRREALPQLARVEVPQDRSG